jgi:hypothetical protein
MPDTTRTIGEADALAREITRIAIVGLGSPAELARRQRATAEFPISFRLDRVVAAGDDVDSQAIALVQVLIEASREIEALDLSAMAQALIGADARYRDWPYDRRRGQAVRIWDPHEEKVDESFTRRPLKRIVDELALVALGKAGSVATDDGSRRTRRASLEDHRPTPNLERLAFRADVWLTGADQRIYQSERTYRDRATAAGVDSVRMFIRSGNIAAVEPTTESIASVENRGLDGSGYMVWVVKFREPLEEDEEIEWGTRRIYREPTADLWVALTVTHSTPAPPIKQGTFVAHLDAQYPPKRVHKFVTPKDTLPNIHGETEELTPTRTGLARADFRDLETWQTYGIRWWPHGGDD